MTAATERPPAAADQPVLTVREMRKEFYVGHPRRTLVAVDGISFDLYPGQTLAVVGESGSGKSTLARCIIRLVEPTSGDVDLDGTSMRSLGAAQLTHAYRRIQMVFQDPNSSMNARMTVRQALSEPLRLHRHLPKADRDGRCLELVEMVGLGREHLDRFPHQLSGGQRQRIGIARALAAEPDAIILDEPTSSLDVSVRGRVLDLLKDLQERLHLAYLFITHDLQVVQRVSDRIAVMYLGSVVEEGPTATVFDHPEHPYTRALLSAAPSPEWGVRRGERFRLSGEIPSPIGLPDSCRLVGRCPLEQPSCHHGRPPLAEVRRDGDSPLDHRVACPVVIGAPALELHPPSSPDV